MKKATLKKPNSTTAAGKAIMEHVNALAYQSIRGNGRITIHVQVAKDGRSLVMKSSSAAMKAGIDPTSTSGVKRRDRAESQRRGMRISLSPRGSTESPRVLAEESLEETQAIARTMDDNLERNKIFYQGLKRLVTS